MAAPPIPQPVSLPLQPWAHPGAGSTDSMEGGTQHGSVVWSLLAQLSLGGLVTRLDRLASRCCWGSRAVWFSQATGRGAPLRTCLCQGLSPGWRSVPSPLRVVPTCCCCDQCFLGRPHVEVCVHPRCVHEAQSQQVPASGVAHFLSRNGRIPACVRPPTPGFCSSPIARSRVDLCSCGYECDQHLLLSALFQFLLSVHIQTRC